MPFINKLFFLYSTLNFIDKFNNNNNNYDNGEYKDRQRHVFKKYWFIQKKIRSTQLGVGLFVYICLKFK